MKGGFQALSKITGWHIWQISHLERRRQFGKAAILGPWHEKQMLLCSLSVCKPKLGKQFMTEDAEQSACELMKTSNNTVFNT